MRHIISTITSPSHFLVKILYNELKQCFPTPKSHINNTFEFKKKIENISIPDNYVFFCEMCVTYDGTWQAAQ